jgi:ribose-phosphate pyrophosphokinase
MKIFSGSSNKPLAIEIAKHLQLPLSPLEIFTFPDGERRVRVEETVVEEDVIIVQSTSSPVDENYMELFFIADAVKRSGAKSITVVVPYLGYQRQDHVFRGGEAVSLDVVIHMLEATGVGSVIVFDLHSIKIAEEFKIPLKHLSALQLFAQRIKSEGWENAESVLVSPDMGGVRRIKIVSEMLNNMSYIAIEKNRDLATGNVEATQMHGEAKKRAIIVDDIIASGKTIAIAADLLKKNNVSEVYVFATHPVFGKEAPKILQDANVEKVFVTDTIAIPTNKRFDKLEILSVAGMIAASFSV